MRVCVGVVLIDRRFQVFPPLCGTTGCSHFVLTPKPSQNAVIPAQAGIHVTVLLFSAYYLAWNFLKVYHPLLKYRLQKYIWIPACAGMTAFWVGLGAKLKSVSPVMHGGGLEPEADCFSLAIAYAKRGVTQ